MGELLPPRYRQPELIARGGMGEIYRAEDGVLGRVVAVKLLAERFADDDGIRRRFTHEALAAARLSNAPNTVTIFDVGEHEGRPYIVMEYLPGGSLADRLAAEGAQPPGRALEWLRQTAAALDAAHAAGIVHRDVKPANLLLDDEGDVRVADFGIASAVGLDSFTAAGTVLGTAGYLAPEQARRERRRPPRATATPSRWSPSSCSPARARSGWTRPRPRPRRTSTARFRGRPSATRSCPPQVDDVLAQGLAKEPEQRFAACADLVHALHDALDTAAGRTAVGAVPAFRRAPSRGRIPLLAAGIAALVLAGLGLAAVLDTDDPTRSAASRRPRPSRIPAARDRAARNREGDRDARGHDGRGDRDDRRRAGARAHHDRANSAADPARADRPQQAARRR